MISIIAQLEADGFLSAKITNMLRKKVEMLEAEEEYLRQDQVAMRRPSRLLALLWQSQLL
jgi:hypothetical protein